MRTLPGVLIVAWVVAAVSAPAYADDQPPAYSRISGAVALIMRDDKGGGSETTSAGLNLEIAVGHSRFQYFIEGSNSWLRGSRDGFEQRGGLGVRWLARAFEVGDEGSFDMHIEGISGLTRMVQDDTRTVYPDLGVGIGFAVRMKKPTRLSIRMTARAMFAQTEREMSCRTQVGAGSCTPSSSVPGFVALMGFGW